MSRPISQFFRSQQPVVVLLQRGEYPRITSVHSTLSAAERLACGRRKDLRRCAETDRSWLSGVTLAGETRQSAARRIGATESERLWGAVSIR